MNRLILALPVTIVPVSIKKLVTVSLIVAIDVVFIIMAYNLIVAM